MVALLLSRDTESFNYECEMRLPDGNTVLLRELSILKHCGVNKLVMPSTADAAISTAVSLGFSVFHADPRLLSGELSERILRKHLPANIVEDLLVIPQQAVFSLSAIQGIIAEKGDSILVGETSQTKPDLSAVYFNRTLPIDFDVLNEQCEFLPDNKKYPLYRISACHFSDALAPDAVDMIGNDTDIWQMQVISCIDNQVVWLADLPFEELSVRMISICLDDLNVWSGADPVFHLRQYLAEQMGIRTPLLIYEEGDETAALTCWRQSKGTQDMICVPKEGILDLGELFECVSGDPLPDAIIALGDIGVQDTAVLLRKSLNYSVSGHRKIQLVSIPSRHALLAMCSDPAHIQSLERYDIANLYITNLVPGWEEVSVDIDSARMASHFCFSQAISLLLELGDKEDLAEFALSAGKTIKNELFTRQWQGSNDINFTKSIVSLSAARAQSSATQADMLASYLHMEMGIPLETAVVMATAALLPYYLRNNRNRANAMARKYLADAIDEIASLLQVSSQDLPEALADLLYYAGWNPTQDMAKPKWRDIEKYLMNSHTNTVMTISAKKAEEALQPFFDEKFSICRNGERRIMQLTEAGFDPGCMSIPQRYKDFLQIRKERTALCAMAALQLAYYEIFSSFHSFCEKHKLVYILLGDTLRGATYYGGLLPYSSRFEIAMPIPDLDYLMEHADFSSTGICVLTNQDSSGVRPGCIKLSLVGSKWITDTNILALGDDKSVGITINPLHNTAGLDSPEEGKLFAAAKKADLLVLHKQGYAHRDVGWKGELVFSLAKRVPVSVIEKLKEKLIQQSFSGDNCFLYDRGTDYRNSLIPKESVYSSKLVPFGKDRARVPNQIIARLETECTEPIVDKQQNDFLMPGTYFLSLGNGSIPYNVSEPPTKPPKVYSIKKTVKREFNTWYKKTKPKVQSFVRTQRVRVVGNIRGAGICLKPSSRDLKSYHNKYLGQRCFLVGNGPSLRAEDLDRLQGEVTFGCNFIHKIYGQTDWRPTFHFISDSGTVRTASWDIVKHLDEEKTTMFIREFAYDYMYAKPKHAVLVPYVSTEHYKVHGNFLAYHYISHATVMSMMIEAAFYMGFKEIYLIGVDGTTSSSKGGNFAKNYFSDAQREKLDQLKKAAIQNYNVYERRRQIQERQNMVYTKLREYAEKHEIMIYNASRGGALDVFERADFDVVLDNS